MTEVAVEILVILGLILLNGLFAMSEIAIISSRRTRLQQMAATGNQGAATALELAEEPNRFLSTVQVGITLVSILNGAFGGSTIAEPLSDLLSGLPALAPYADALSLALVVSVITYLTVVMGELVPKRLALQGATTLASLVSRPMRLLSIAATPVVRLFSVSTDLVLRLLGVSDPAVANVTEEEIRILMAEGVQAGSIPKEEQEMIEGVFRLDDRPLMALMTPRTEIEWLDVNALPETLWAQVTGSSHSRFPVCDGDLDRVIGLVGARDLLETCKGNHDLDLRQIMYEPLYLPANMRARQSLERFRQTGRQIALLIDEYGGVEGLVTLFDILEAIVGDIPTMEELAEPPVMPRDDGSWLVDGLMLIDDFKAYFGISHLPAEGDYNTLGGFMIHNIGHLPRSGNSFTWSRWRFEVMDMDGNRIDKVLVQLVPPPGTAEDETGG